jgi:hypothetical protein
MQPLNGLTRSYRYYAEYATQSTGRGDRMRC